MENWILPIVTALIIPIILYVFLETPRITTPYSEGWVLPHKRVNTFQTRENAADTNAQVKKELKTRDYYTFYGITIRNERPFIRPTEAKINRVSMKIWNSKHEPVTSQYDVRWWNRKRAGVEPLFSGKKQPEEVTLGQAQEIDLVIAYNQENEAIFYRFTIETPTHPIFPVYADRFKDPMPHYGILRIYGNTTKDIYLCIELGNHDKELRMRIIPKRDFPSQIKATNL